MLQDFFKLGKVVAGEHPPKPPFGNHPFSNSVGGQTFPKTVLANPRLFVQLPLYAAECTRAHQGWTTLQGAKSLWRMALT